MFGEEPFEQTGVADAAVATKDFKLGHVVGKELHLPPLPRHYHLHQAHAFTNLGQREMDARFLKLTEEGG